MSFLFQFVPRDPDPDAKEEEKEHSKYSPFKIGFVPLVEENGNKKPEDSNHVKSENSALPVQQNGTSVKAVRPKPKVVSEFKGFKLLGYVPRDPVTVDLEVPISAKKRILITGASGMLGRTVLAELKSHPECICKGLGFRRLSNELHKVDLTKKEEIQQFVREFKPNLIIHCAAQRHADAIETSVKDSEALNVTATDYICEAAVSVGACVLFMSTDYVFDGTSPPYDEQAEPNPLNKYGQQKLAAEKIVMNHNKKNIILRIPVLYGPVECLEEGPITSLYLRVYDTSKLCYVTHGIRKYPTHTEDVANVIYDIITLRDQDSTVEGIYHWSDIENKTQYDMTIAMAQSVGLSTGHILKDHSNEFTAERPQDACLDTSKLEELGICHRRLFSRHIADCITPHFMKSTDAS